MPLIIRINAQGFNRSNAQPFPRHRGIGLRYKNAACYSIISINFKSLEIRTTYILRSVIITLERSLPVPHCFPVWGRLSRPLPCCPQLKRGNFMDIVICHRHNLRGHFCVWIHNQPKSRWYMTIPVSRPFILIGRSVLWRRVQPRCL